MKNLKKILSMALATVMVMSLMVVGAGAASFSDPETVENTEAVEVVSALNIIGGYPDGTFRGEQPVTRAEMAKMICVALNGGVEPTLGTSDTPTYTDVRDSADAWAESYIDYCTNLGIVSGVGGGRFNPSRTVTGAEAAKMLLVALGYDSDIFGFTGADWATNVAIKANEADLYDDLDLGTANKPLTRDEAAQMISNTLEAYIMERTYDKVVNNGEISYKYALSDSTTFLNKYFEAYTFIGTYKGNSDSLGLSTSGQVRAEGCLDTEDKDSVSATVTFTSDLDISNIGEEIKVIFKDGTSGTKYRPDRNDTIYGVFNTGRTEVINATLNDIKTGDSAPTATNKIKVGSTEYKVATPAVGDVLVQYNYNSSTDVSVTKAADATAKFAKDAFEAASVAQSGDTVKFVTDDNGDITTAYVVETRIGYVTSVTNDKVGISGIGTIDIDDNEVYSGVAKDDVINYTRLYDTDKDEAYFIVTEAESVSGELTGYKVQTGTYRNVTLDGTDYSFYTRQAALTSATIGENDTRVSLNSDDIGETFTAYMVNGYVGYLIQGSDSANKLALVTDLNDGKLGANLSDPKVELLLADGTKVIGAVHGDSIIYDSSNNAIADDGTVAINATGNLAKGALVRYNETSAGVYKIVEVISVEKNGYSLKTSTNTSTPIYDKDTKSFDGVVTSGDCVLFVKNITDSEYKAYNIRNLNNVTATTQNSSYIVKDGRVVAAYVELTGRPSGAAGDMVYGIVSGFAGTRKVDGDFYNAYTVVNDAETYTIYLDENSTHPVKTGAIVGFEPSGDSIYNDGDIKIYDGTAYTAANGLATYVKSFSESDRTLTYWSSVSYNSTTKTYTGSGATTVALDDDCVIVYVNAKDDKAGDNIGISSFDSATGYKNVLLIKDSSTSKVVGIIVETSGECNIDD